VAKNYHDDYDDDYYYYYDDNDDDDSNNNNNNNNYYYYHPHHHHQSGRWDKCNWYSDSLSAKRFVVRILAREIFSSPKTPIPLFKRAWAFFPEAKRPGRVGDHSPPLCAGVKK
jgi:hypothetical protein